jgi:hypothetical protein
MGHALHLLEGVIVELKNGIKRNKHEYDQVISGAEAASTTPEDIHIANS